jgi:hypothetical protein
VVNALNHACGVAMYFFLFYAEYITTVGIVLQAKYIAATYNKVFAFLCGLSFLVLSYQYSVICFGTAVISTEGRNLFRKLLALSLLASPH